MSRRAFTALIYPSVPVIRRSPPDPELASAGRWAGSVIPETKYARQGDLHLAYQVLGEGPPDILVLDQWSDR